MKLTHRLGPYTFIPDHCRWPAELAGMLLKTEDPRGCWGFIGQEDPRDSRMYNAIGEKNGLAIAVEFARPEMFDHAGIWYPMRMPKERPHAKAPVHVTSLYRRLASRMWRVLLRLYS